MEARRSRLIGACVVLLVCLALGLALRPGPAGAAGSGDITILQNDARSDFPRQVVYHLAAQSTSPITSARLAYRIADDPVTIVAAASLTPGRQIQTTYTINLQQEYLPPGVTLHYRWQIDDQSGAHLDGDWTDLKLVDPRFLWHERTQGAVTLHWYDGDTSFSDAVLSAAATAFAAASQLAPNGQARPVQVYLYSTEQDFRSALGAGAEEWVGGQAFPAYRVVVLYSPPQDPVAAQRSVAEEMTHLALDGGSSDAIGQLPTWLDEGLAVVAEGDPAPVFVQALQDAAKAHRLMSLQSLSGNFPESTEEATLAYAESDSAVRYFVQTYGRQKLRLLVEAFRRGMTSDEAFQASIGRTTLEFERAWQRTLQPAEAEPSPTPAGSPLVRLVSGPLDLIAGVIRDVLRFLQSAKTQPA